MNTSTLSTYTDAGVPFTMPSFSIRTKRNLVFLIEDIFSKLKSGLLFNLEGEAEDSVSFYVPIESDCEGMEDEDTYLDGQVIQYEFKLYSNYAKEEQRYTISISQFSLYEVKKQQAFNYEQCFQGDWGNSAIFDYLWKQRNELKKAQVTY